MSPRNRLYASVASCVSAAGTRCSAAAEMMSAAGHLYKEKLVIGSGQ